MNKKKTALVKGQPPFYEETQTPVVKDLPETLLEDLVGCANYRGPKRSLMDMQAAIAKGAWKRRC